LTGRTIRVLALLLLAAPALSSVASAGEAPTPCDETALAGIPARPADAMTGSEFASRVETLSEDDREQAIETELLSGNMPAFLTRLAPVTLRGTSREGRSVRVMLCVFPDYLAIGSDRDFVYAPMRLATALTVASRYGFTIPTVRMVDAIYAQSAVHLAPQPLPAGERMRSIAYYRHHSELIEGQRNALGAQMGLLTAGHKKDLVITNRLRRFPDRVAIYGWHRSERDPIQPLSTVHGARYADYSHGVRLVSAVVYVDGEARSMAEVLADPQLASVVSEDGPIPELARFVAGLQAPFAGAGLASR
jgi:hypothetical protein